MHRQVYITQLLTNGAQNLHSHPLEENDMKILVGIFCNALYTYAARYRKFPREKEREGGCTWKCKLYGYDIVILYGYLSE